MSVGQVNKRLRLQDFSSSNISSFDISTVKIKHEYKPGENYIFCEMKIPSLTKSMTDYDAEFLREMAYWDTYHQIKYNAVGNKDFFAFMKREDVYKFRIKGEDGLIYTYYMSKSRTLGFMEYDYFPAVLIYTLYPLRNFIRRAPCTKLDPECEDCQDYVDAPIEAFLDYDPSVAATFDKYCFGKPGEIHNLCVGYTVDTEHDMHKENNTTAPDYFVLELTSPYFKSATHNYEEWKLKVMSRRSAYDGEMYRLYDGSGAYSGHGTTGIFGFETGRMSQGTSVSIDSYNMSTGVNVPQDMADAISEMDFDKFWTADFRGANARNTLHKHQFNAWVYEGNVDKDGFFCAWDMNEAFDSSTVDLSGDSVSAAKDQLAQVGALFGWGFDDSEESGRSATFELISPRYPSIDYEVFIEEIPDRKPF